MGSVGGHHTVFKITHVFTKKTKMGGLTDRFFWGFMSLNSDELTICWVKFEFGLKGEAAMFILRSNRLNKSLVLLGSTILV